MNEHMKMQIRAMLISLGSFRNSVRVSAMKDDGMIDRIEEKTIRKIEKATEKYEKQLKKLIREQEKP